MEIDEETRDALTAAISEFDADFDGVAVARLGDMQKHVLRFMAAGSVPWTAQYVMGDLSDIEFEEQYCDDETEGWVRYSTLTDSIHDDVAEREHAGEHKDNALQASVSRSVSSLIERGMLAGAVRAWHVISTEQGDSPPVLGRYPWDPIQTMYEDRRGSRPPIKWLRLRPDGWAAIAKLSDEIDFAVPE